MATTDMAMAFNITPSLLEQLSKALIELEAHKDGVADTVSVTEIIQHFRDLEAKMIKKHAELEAKEKAFKQDEHDSRALLAAQETAISAKEQDMIDRIQVLKDAAVAAIAETRANHLPPSVSIDTVDPTENKGMRESCIVLIEAMNAMLAKADDGRVDHLLTYEIKQQAKAIADEWWPKLVGHDRIIDAVSGKSVEAEAFLQLLSAFKIASEFAEDELCKLVIAVCERRQAPQICRSLGLAHKMPGVIEQLINKGKLIGAVHFVHAFELVEKFPTVTLLKTYLKDLRRNSQMKRIKSPHSESVQNEGNMKELAAVKDVIYCIEEYDLESEYPLEPLQRRVGQLERAKPDTRKRFRESPTKRDSTSRHESTRKRESNSKRDSTNKRESAFKRPPYKKPRSNVDGIYGNHSPAANYLSVNGRHATASVYMDRGLYSAPPYNYQPTPPHNQSTYSQRVYEQKAYYYRPDDRSAVTTAAPTAYESTYYYPPDDRTAAAAAAPTPSAYENTYYYASDNRAAVAPPPAPAYENVYYYPPDDRSAAAAAAAQPVPPPHAYVGYHGSGVPSSYQPYN